MRRIHSGAFSSVVLGLELDKFSLPKQDRALITDLIYGTLRYELYLDICLKHYLKHPKKLPPEIFQVLRLGAYDILIRKTPRYAAVNEWVEVCKLQDKSLKCLSSLVNAVLRRLEHSDKTSIARLSVPDWLYDKWCKMFGQEKAKFVAEAMLEPQTLNLKSYHPKAKISLEEQGCKLAEHILSNMLSVQVSMPLQTLKAYKAGWVQPQNPAATLPVNILAPKRDEYVLDLCSGNGIKTAQLSKLGAKVTGVELNSKKIERAQKNLQRLGLEADLYQHDLCTVPSLPPATKVLLDAPCSGTGTLRGNPEIRKRVTKQSIGQLASLQCQLLETAAALTQRGGILVYAVCALTRAEGENIIKNFLENHSEFSAEDFTLQVPSVKTNLGQYILPLEQLDGFFIALMKKG